MGSLRINRGLLEADLCLFGRMVDYFVQQTVLWNLHHDQLTFRMLCTMRKNPRYTPKERKGYETIMAL
jgi:hypothetical protein